MELVIHNLREYDTHNMPSEGKCELYLACSCQGLPACKGLKDGTLGCLLEG